MVSRNGVNFKNQKVVVKTTLKVTGECRANELRFLLIHFPENLLSSTVFASWTQAKHLKRKPNKQYHKENQG